MIFNKLFTARRLIITLSMFFGMLAVVSLAFNQSAFLPVAKAASLEEELERIIRMIWDDFIGGNTPRQMSMKCVTVALKFDEFAPKELEVFTYTTRSGEISFGAGVGEKTSTHAFKIIKGTNTAGVRHVYLAEISWAQFRDTEHIFPDFEERGFLRLTDESGNLNELVWRRFKKFMRDAGLVDSSFNELTLADLLKDTEHRLRLRPDLAKLTPAQYKAAAEEYFALCKTDPAKARALCLSLEEQVEAFANWEEFLKKLRIKEYSVESISKEYDAISRIIDKLDTELDQLANQPESPALDLARRRMNLAREQQFLLEEANSLYKERSLLESPDASQRALAKYTKGELDGKIADFHKTRQALEQEAERLLKEMEAQKAACKPPCIDPPPKVIVPKPDPKPCSTEDPVAKIAKKAAGGMSDIEFAREGVLVAEAKLRLDPLDKSLQEQVAIAQEELLSKEKYLKDVMEELRTARGVPAPQSTCWTPPDQAKFIELLEKAKKAAVTEVVELSAYDILAVADEFRRAQTEVADLQGELQLKRTLPPSDAVQQRITEIENRISTLQKDLVERIEPAHRAAQGRFAKLPSETLPKNITELLAKFERGISEARLLGNEIRGGILSVQRGIGVVESAMPELYAEIRLEAAALRLGEATFAEVGAAEANAMRFFTRAQLAPLWTLEAQTVLSGATATFIDGVVEFTLGRIGLGIIAADIVGNLAIATWLENELQDVFKDEIRIYEKQFYADVTEWKNAWASFHNLVADAHEKEQCKVSASNYGSPLYRVQVQNFLTRLSMLEGKLVNDLTAIVNASILERFRTDDSWQKTVASIIGQETDWGKQGPSYSLKSEHVKLAIQRRIARESKIYRARYRVEWLGGRVLESEPILPREQAKIQKYLKTLSSIYGGSYNISPSGFISPQAYAWKAFEVTFEKRSNEARVEVIKKFFANAGKDGIDACKRKQKALAKEKEALVKEKEACDQPSPPASGCLGNNRLFNALTNETISCGSLDDAVLQYRCCNSGVYPMYEVDQIIGYGYTDACQGQTSSDWQRYDSDTDWGRQAQRNMPCYGAGSPAPSRSAGSGAAGAVGRAGIASPQVRATPSGNAVISNSATRAAVEKLVGALLRSKISRWGVKS